MTNKTLTQKQLETELKNVLDEFTIYIFNTKEQYALIAVNPKNDIRSTFFNKFRVIGYIDGKFQLNFVNHGEYTLIEEAKEKTKEEKFKEYLKKQGINTYETVLTHEDEVCVKTRELVYGIHLNQIKKFGYEIYSVDCNLTWFKVIKENE